MTYEAVVVGDRVRIGPILRGRMPRLSSATPVGGWAGVPVATPDGWPPLGAWHRAWSSRPASGGSVQRVAGAEAVAQVMLGQKQWVDIARYSESRSRATRVRTSSFGRSPCITRSDGLMFGRTAVAGVTVGRLESETDAIGAAGWPWI